MRRLLLLALLGASLGALPLRAATLPAQGSVEVLFTPWDDAEGAILRVLAEARRTVHVQAFILTSRAIARSLRQAHERGVAVEVLADKGMATKGGEARLRELAAAGVPVRLESRYASAHHKLILADAEGEAPVVVTGSYNFSWSAQARNAENLLILRGNPPLARRYLDNWRRHRDDAEPWRTP